MLQLCIYLQIRFAAEDGMVPEELLLNRHTLQELLNGAAKLKSLGATEMISIDRLVRLLNILEINVRGGDRISPISDVRLIFKKVFYNAIRQIAGG